MSAMDSKDSPVNPLLSRFEKPLCDISSTLDPADWSYLQDKFQCPTFAPDSGMPFSDLKREVAQLAEKWKDLPRPCVKARCFAYVCEHVQLAVSPHDWFVGLGCWNRYDKPLSAVISRWMDEVFSQKLADASTLIDQHNRAGTLAMWMDYDHSVPDWDAVLSLGFEGLRKRALSYREQRRARSEMTPEAEAYFEAIEIQYTAVHQLLSRLIAYAETHNDGSARMRRVLHALRHLQFHPPTDTLEALELIDLYFMLSEHIDCLQVRSLGNLDRTLFPFYQRDLETGRYSEGEIRQLYSHFMMQFASINNYWGHPFYLGGTDEHGASTFNALSSLILEEFEKLDVTSPKLQLKLNHNTPDALLNQALDMIRRHNSSLVFVCEPGLTRAMMGIGRTAEEARTCDINGCYEYNVRAREVKTAPIYLNLLKPIELVFHDGVDPVSGIKIGLHTGTQFTTFDDFYQAYIRQLEHVLDDGLHCVDSFEPYLMEINPTPLFSATITHSLETAKDAFANGSQYNNTILLHTGLATTVDALMAVKQLVYEQHTVTLAEMKAALDANWNGYALLRQKALRTPEKFGCHTPASDRYAQAIARFTSTKVNLRPNVRGGFYKAAMHSARTFITFGAQCGATPDGRLAGEEMSKNLSPTMGMDTRGVTALIESAIGVDSAQFPEDYCLDVMLHPATTQGTDGLTAMRALLTTYMRGNGVALHFNVFDPATLEDAQQHPEKYRGLQVRVCGWNVLFSNLCRKEQDAYILRARNITQS